MELEVASRGLHLSPEAGQELAITATPIADMDKGKLDSRVSTEDVMAFQDFEKPSGNIKMKTPLQLNRTILEKSTPV